MVFPASGGAIATMRKVYGKADEISITVELVIAMLMSIVPICVVMETREYHRATGRTTGCRAEGVIEESAVVGQCIEIGCLESEVPICSEVRALVIGYEQDDVALGGLGNPQTDAKQANQSWNEVHDE